MTTNAKAWVKAGSSGLIFAEPAGVVLEPLPKTKTVDLAVLFGLKAPASQDEALFGTTLRSAAETIRDW